MRRFILCGIASELKHGINMQLQGFSYLIHTGFAVEIKSNDRLLRIKLFKLWKPLKTHSYSAFQEMWNNFEFFFHELWVIVIESCKGAVPTKPMRKGLQLDHIQPRQWWNQETSFTQ